MSSLTAIPLVSKLSKGVIRILGCNPGPMTLQGTNTYLIGTGLRRILIDSGDAETANEYTKLLEEVLHNEGATIEHLIITHWHHDHIGGVESVKNLLKLRNTRAKSPTVWKLSRSLEDRGNDGQEESYSVEWRSMNDGQLFEVDGAKLQIHHTPGHTTDHACLTLLEDNSLFSGDCILGEGTAVFEDLHDYILSLEKIIQMTPKVIYPGHGPVIESPVPRIQYYIRHRQQRENEILKVLQEHGTMNSLSEMDIVQRIYTETPENLWNAAAANVRHHLEKLLKERKVRGENGAWFSNI
ncbi:beta-lactamase-like protein 2 homolog [Cephus cinctus]|uniref:Beta-lactamase-like protein 2 homolog n=1 Tax=Cephus cinctus TaxID=211228 RepID=A0AAJ7CHG2_CEPCN|nr:beta-lactamase-like protein 2 homolog [Cephus cinctus]